MTRFCIHLAPYLLGGGVRLFDALPDGIRLESYPFVMARTQPICDTASTGGLGIQRALATTAQGDSLPTFMIFERVRARSCSRVLGYMAGVTP